MPRNPVPVLVFVSSLLAVVIAFAYYRASEGWRLAATQRVSEQRSEIRLDMTVTYGSGVLAKETYAMSDIGGTSTMQYRVLGNNGLAITIVERPRATLEEGMNVAYLFDELVRDGIWDLPSKPPRGETATRYAVGISQLAGNTNGSHRFTFTDPHYWATTGGHQFHITLSKNKPIPNLLQLSSTTLVEPRYGEVVADFRGFGPASFRSKVVAARVRLGART